jgi:predicted esterase
LTLLSFRSLTWQTEHVMTMMQFRREHLFATVLHFAAVCTFAMTPSAHAQDWPVLPQSNATVTIPAQEWAFAPGPRTVAVYIHYPGGDQKNVTPETGLMLCVHNWGGTHAIGAPDPDQMAEMFNVVAISVDYLQSGKYDAAQNGPYDFGYLQALDALRALYFVYDGLNKACVPFDKARIFAGGGSGGGNVSLMANKLAPRTFACVVDLSGMAKLTDDIAFDLPDGSKLSAGYSNDPTQKNYLSPGEQRLRFIGEPGHLAAMKSLGNAAKIVVIHGESDTVCPVDDAREMIENFQAVGLDVDPHIVTADMVDGETFKDTAHSLGDRTKILAKFAGQYLDPKSPARLRREGPADFDRHDDVRYSVPGGAFVISYANGYPVGQFEAGHP